MNKPLVSIILPVFNGEKTLKATLESLLSQTYPHFELLIGIDGTKDNSKAIANAFDDNRIQVFENEKNLGLGPNLNKLISLTSPEATYIAMAEQDDVYVLERLQWQVDAMEQDDTIGLVSGIAEFKSKSGSVFFPGILVKGHDFLQGKELFKYLYVNQLKVVNTCMMLRKSVHINNGLTFNNTYGNFNVDWDYVLRLALVSRVYGIPKKLVTMNRGLANSSVTRDKTLQHKASKLLLKNMSLEFPDLITKQTYRDALKMHLKIELGHRSKFDIIFYGLYYTLRYFDSYFLKYLLMRMKIFYGNI